MLSSFYIIHPYRAASGGSGLRGARADRPGAGRGARGAAAPGRAVVRGTIAGARLRSGGHRRANL